MNQLHSAVQAPAETHVANYAIPPAKNRPRLVVVIREVEEEALLAGRIRELARARGLPVLLLGVARDSSTEAKLKRGLITIAAFLREGSAHAGTPEIQMEHGRDWMNRVTALLQPGDMLACYAEQQTAMFERPLSDLLSRGLNIPIYTFEGAGAERTSQNRLAQAASWAGSLACIGAFLVLQARIVLAFQGWLQSALMLVALLAEVGSVWFVNSLSAQL